MPQNALKCSIAKGQSQLFPILLSIAEINPILPQPLLVPKTLKFIKVKPENPKTSAVESLDSHTEPLAKTVKNPKGTLNPNP